MKGCHVVYEAHADMRGYLIAPEWTDRSPPTAVRRGDPWRVLGTAERPEGRGLAPTFPDSFGSGSSSRWRAREERLRPYPRPRNALTPAWHTEADLDDLIAGSVCS